jgi:dihydrofolate synthase/folylpolyglutamate synthase
LEFYTERIRLDGSSIDPETFAEEVERVRLVLEKAAAEGVIPEPKKRFATLFEVLTAAAFDAFSRFKVDAAVIETGLGGRLDSTNVVSPVVTVITPVDRDHIPLLGNTIAEIAVEKAGIIKPGVPLVLAPQKPEAEEPILRTAREQGCAAIKVNELYEVSILSRTEAGYEFEFRRTGEPWYKARTRLLGDHQVTNALVAMEAVRVFLAATGRPLDPERSAAAIEKADWPTRTEWIAIPTVSGNTVSLLLDSAHTEQGAKALRMTLDQVRPGESFVFLIGMSSNKEMAAFLRALLRPGDNVITSAVDNPRAMSAEGLLEIARQNVPGGDTEYWRSVLKPGEALKSAIEMAERRGRLLCAAGSVYFAGALRAALRTLQTV